MSSADSRPEARCPGQNGSSVWAEVTTLPTMSSCSWATTGKTPNSLIPTALTPNEAVQRAVAPGFTLAGRRNGVPAGSRSLSVPRVRKESIPSRVEKWSGDAYSCTSSPAAVWPVPLLIVPVTVTVAPGPAYRGFIEVMAIETRPPPARAGAAWAGPASASEGASAAQIVAAVSPAAAARDSVRRLTVAVTFAVSKPCTPGMLLPFARNPCLSIRSMAVPMNPEQRKAAAALLRERVPDVAGIGRLFAAHGHELALVGGPVRDVFLGQRPGDLDLTTDAPPQRVIEMTRGWADQGWTIGIGFGTVGLRKDGTDFEITTYRSEHYERGSRKPDVTYGTSLEDDLARRDFTVNAMAARLPGYDLVDPFGGLADLAARRLRTPASPQ